MNTFLERILSVTGSLEAKISEGKDVRVGLLQREGSRHLRTEKVQFKSRVCDRTEVSLHGKYSSKCTASLHFSNSTHFKL